MGMSFSCSREEIDGFEESFGTMFTRSLSFVQNAQAALRSFSFGGRPSELAILGAFGSEKILTKGSLSFNGRSSEPFQLETKVASKSSDAKEVKSSKPEAQRISRFSPLRNMTNDSETNGAGISDSEDNVSKAVGKTARFAHLKGRSLEEVVVDEDSPKHEAAVKLQKVYRSFRTRRQLADCAVLIEQRWWKLLDFALLKRSSVSFFDIEREESAVSKWSRAKSRAAKVGKGLSKDEKAQKLALQHWLEAIDPRHRYGHNLHFYYDCWLQCESKQPFFYWLDVGEGKEVNLLDQCPRSKLQKQCIKYLGPKERESYEVIVEDGKFMYKVNKQLLNTTDGGKDDKWIFVLSTSRTMYVGQKKKGKFQHSSFLAGGATSAAGRLVIENGILKAVWPHSGHYRPTQRNFEEFMSFLEENNVDVSAVQKSPVDDDDEFSSISRSTSTQVNLSISSGDINPENATTGSSSVDDSEQREQSREKPELKVLEIPALDGEETEERITDDKPTNSTTGEEDEAEFVPEEKILKRINSKKGLKSYQLGKQLTCKWTTGAGPRIGCVRDYPSELQFRTLEDVHLSPRSAGISRFTTASPRSKLQDVTTPKELRRDIDHCLENENCIM